ncbi:MAG TPA: helix-turn-helix domain-containing protein, partial [Cyclobacteriaceae bacterium]|nr:helix-turn-helix domain-containing protein [Cyclobacteriaceae bacterium]
EVLLTKLKKIMVDEKPYLRSDFSQPDLAKACGISVHQVSQVINDGLGKNFFEWVAGYRVEEAKKLLIDRPNIKVEEIAEQVGYNSKSSFNTVFKKITGNTPSEYRTMNTK